MYDDRYDNEQMRNMMIQSTRRKTTLLSLVCLVITLISLCTYLIFFSSPADEAKSEEEGEPTEGVMEKEEDVSLIEKNHIDASDLEDIIDKFSWTMTIMPVYEAELDKRDEIIEKLTKELDEVYSFIEELNNYLGGINVITDQDKDH